MNCVSENAVTLRIENEIVSQIVYVKKTPRLLKNEEKKKELLSNLNKIFDIAYCKCYIDKTKEHYIYSNCVCPDGKKIVNFETYTQQVFDNEAILLSEEEKTKYDNIYPQICISNFNNKHCNCSTLKQNFTTYLRRYIIIEYEYWL